MRKQGAKWSFPEPLIKTALHPGLHRLITKGWNLFFYIWRKHWLHKTEGFTAPSSNLGLQHTAIRQNMDGQPEPWTSGRDGYSLLTQGEKKPWGPTVSNKNCSPGKLVDDFFLKWILSSSHRWVNLTFQCAEDTTLHFVLHNPYKIGCLEENIYQHYPYDLSEIQVTHCWSSKIQR